MKILLVNGKGVALVGREDYERLSRFRWYLTAKKYAAWYCKGKLIYMHHEILPKQVGFEVDHRNGNGLDNRRRNLRYATHSQNLHNQRRTTGVSQNRGKWRARLMVNKKEIWLGYHPSRKAAQKAVDTARKDLVKL